MPRHIGNLVTSVFAFEYKKKIKQEGNDVWYHYKYVTPHLLSDIILWSV